MPSCLLLHTYSAHCTVVSVQGCHISCYFPHVFVDFLRAVLAIGNDDLSLHACAGSAEMKILAKINDCVSVPLKKNPLRSFNESYI